MNSFNLSGTFNIFRLILTPTLSLPQATVSHFSQLPTPLSSAFPPRGEKHPDIRAVVLDKDNCFAVPNTNEIHPSCAARFAELRHAFPGDKLVIVSNSAGATGTTNGEAEAKMLEKETGVTVLRHAVKKPGCGEEILRFLRSKPETGVRHAGHVAVIGDRVFTDVLMANMMGAHAIWVRDGVVAESGLITRIEKSLVSFLISRGLGPRQPHSDFE